MTKVLKDRFDNKVPNPEDILENINIYPVYKKQNKQKQYKFIWNEDVPNIPGMIQKWEKINKNDKNPREISDNVVVSNVNGP